MAMMYDDGQMMVVRKKESQAISGQTNSRECVRKELLTISSQSQCVIRDRIAVKRSSALSLGQTLEKPTSLTAAF